MISIPISQDKYKNNLSLLNDFDLKSLPESTICLLQFLLDRSNVLRSIFFSHQSIAAAIGYSDITVRRSLSRLRGLGVIQWKRRMNSSSIYYLNPQILVKDYREKLWKNIHSFFKYFISIRELLSQKHVQEHSDQLDKNKGINSMEYRETMEVIVDENDPFGDRTDPILEKKRIVDRGERDKYLEFIERELPLTLHGKIKLLQYPSECLKYSTSIMKTAMNKYDPFIYLLSVCENFCKENGLPVNFELYRSEKVSLGIAPSDNDFVNHGKLHQMKIAKERASGAGRPDSARQAKLTYHLPAPKARVLSEEEFIKRDKELLSMEPTNIFQEIMQSGIRKKYGLMEGSPV